MFDDDGRRIKDERPHVKNLVIKGGPMLDVGRYVVVLLRRSFTGLILYVLGF